MKRAEWEKLSAKSADAERASHYLSRLYDLTPEVLNGFTTDSARILVTILSASRALSEQLLTHPEWLNELSDVDALRSGRREQGYRRDIAPVLAPSLESLEISSAYNSLRVYKQRQNFRIAARDLGGLANVVELTRELSDLADACLEAVYQLSWAQLTKRHGIPHHPDVQERWQPTAFAILGMGKLGGQELNYSSDADLLFVYSDEGRTFKSAFKGKAPTTTGGIPNYQFFKLLCEMMINELTRMSSEGSLYRIDMRLRPEGKNGPLARSLSSYETYYTQSGQTWERMMLIKTRPVAGDKTLGAEFLEMIQPFRYPRSPAAQIPHEVALTKQRIEAEVVKAGEMERNVKLGRGGIREIEFTVQTLQLIHGGRLPFLQGGQTLPTLEKLSRYELLSRTEVSTLTEAYIFLRNVEHRLQMEDHRQTHSLPADASSRKRIARLMNCATLAEFEKLLKDHTNKVRAIYEKFVQPNTTALDEFPSTFDFVDEWKNVFARHSFLDPEKAHRIAREFVHGPGFGHVSSKTSESGLRLLKQLLEFCPRSDKPEAYPEMPLSDPDRVLARLDSFVTRYGARATLFDAWISNPSLFKLLVAVFDRSEFLAELAIRTPDLIDTLEQTGHIRRRKTREIMLEELRYGKADKDQSFWIRRYFQAELMRIGLREIVGFSNLFQSQTELTALAEALLQYGLEVCSKKHEFKKAPFAVVALGKFGGSELVYGSDLDVVFVAPDSTSSLPKLQKVASDLKELLSARTEQGVTFEVDARLRPDGEKGLLVNTLAAYKDYYRQRAMLWEIQALTRARAVAGDAKVGAEFVALARNLANFKNGSEIAAYSPGWKVEIDRMRRRIETERTPVGKQQLAIKTGSGALIDAEFIAQMIALDQGWHEPNTARAIERATDASALPPADGAVLEQEYLRLVQIEGILRRWSFESEATLPDDPAAQYRVAVRCGFRDAKSFLDAVEQCRTNIRRVYEKVFATAPSKPTASEKKTTPTRRKQPKRVTPE